jgi:glutamyl-tRNA synthetase
MSPAARAGVRFAPSPTGRFHLGNLRTAWIAHAWARALGLPWIVRFEDTDGPRVVAGARERQRDDMAALGLVADFETLQSERLARHWELFRLAARGGAVYPCYCSRREVQQALAAAPSAPHGKEAIYDGRCRNAAAAPRGEAPHGIGWRFRGQDERGTQDFLVARTHGTRAVSAPAIDPSFVPAYHWACAIDDAEERGGPYELIVRAADLETAIASQRAIQSWLAQAAGRPVEFPAVYHCALVTGPRGERLEKRTRGITLPELQAAGWDAARIGERLAASHRVDPAQYRPQRIWGEASAVISLADLGFDQVRQRS